MLARNRYPGLKMDIEIGVEGKGGGVLVIVVEKLDGCGRQQTPTGDVLIGI